MVSVRMGCLCLPSTNPKLVKKKGGGLTVANTKGIRMAEFSKDVALPLFPAKH